MVVDDDPLIRTLLRAVLEDGRIEFIEASDGAEAMRLATEQHPDVVLLDVMMPGANGFEICRAFKASADLKDSRIVMLTARDSAKDREDGMQAGADAFFTKPFSPLEIIDAVAGMSDGNFA